MQADDAELAGLAAKIDREETYHRLHAELWAARLRDEPRFRSAVEELWPYALGVLEPEPAARARRARRASSRRHDAIERGDAPHELRGALGRDDRGAALDPGRAMVTADAVWAALDEIPDPEIPVISLVDLGVIRDVQVDGDRVHVEFTPTFLGCPALEVMRDAIERAVAALGAEPEIAGDPGRLVVDRPDHRPRAARSCALRASRRRPRAARGPTTLVQLQSKAFRCPYCGSTETRLENIFGPTPCRSIRWCESCRQPFEQFKTI